MLNLCFSPLFPRPSRHQHYGKTSVECWTTAGNINANALYKGGPPIRCDDVSVSMCLLFFSFSFDSTPYPPHLPSFPTPLPFCCGTGVCAGGGGCCCGTEKITKNSVFIILRYRRPAGFDHALAVGWGGRGMQAAVSGLLALLWTSRVVLPPCYPEGKEWIYFFLSLALVARTVAPSAVPGMSAVVWGCCGRPPTFDPPCPAFSFIYFSLFFSHSSSSKRASLSPPSES